MSAQALHTVPLAGAYGGAGEHLRGRWRALRVTLEPLEKRARKQDRFLGLKPRSRTSPGEGRAAYPVNGGSVWLGYRGPGPRIFAANADRDAGGSLSQRCAGVRISLLPA